MRRMLLLLTSLVLAVTLFAAVALWSAAGAPVTGSGAYPADVLGRASQMTQQMSGGTVTGHEYHGHTADEQLRLSSNSAFVRELEVYQAQIDRMLARTP